MDKRIPICAIFMDMTKAFDCVDHNILIKKLNVYGIRGNVLNLMESYLNNRKQITEITQICPKVAKEQKYSSQTKIAKYGIPQGSVLGPLLFLIYINDLPRYVEHPMVLFADDSTVIIKCKDRNKYEFEINNTLNMIIQWLTNNNLQINLQKTKIMHFQQRSNVRDISLNYQGEIVNSINVTKFLGIYLDNQFSWKTHLDELCKKINKSAYALYKLTKIVSRETVLCAYHGNVVSVLRYGIIFWGNSVSKDAIFKAQKRCIRAICGLDTTTSCQPYFKHLKLLTLPSLYIYEVSIFVRMNTHLYNIAHKSYYRKLRDKNKLELEITYGAGTALLSKSFLCMAQKIFNRLPDEIKKLNINQFKKCMHKFLVGKCYYTINDFLIDNIDMNNFIVMFH